MTVIGFKRSDFTTKEGNPITGCNLYLSYPLTGADAEGVAVERVYMTDAKLAKCGYTPRLGDEVALSYNRYGKPETIARISL